MTLLEYSKKVGLDEREAKELVFSLTGKKILSSAIDMTDAITEALEKKGLISPESVKKYQKEISDKKKASAEAEIKKVKENTAPSQNPKKDKAVKKSGNNNERIVATMEEIINADRIIMIDTNAVLSGKFVKFMNDAEPLLTKYKKMFIFPHVVYGELLWKKNGNEKQLKDNAKRKLEIIKRFVKDNLAEIVGEDADWPDKSKKPFADPTFLERVLTLRNNGKSCTIITADKDLGHDILSFNNIKSVKTKADIKVYCIDENNGELIEKMR